MAQEPEELPTLENNNTSKVSIHPPLAKDPSSAFEENDNAVVARGTCSFPDLEQKRTDNNIEDRNSSPLVVTVDDNNDNEKSNSGAIPAVATRPAEANKKQPPKNDSTTMQESASDRDKTPELSMHSVVKTPEEEEGKPPDEDQPNSKPMETHRPIPTTATMNLSPFQRAQLAHLKAIFDMARRNAGNENDTKEEEDEDASKADETETKAAAATATTAVNMDKKDGDGNDDVEEDLEYTLAVKQLRDHMERMKEEQKHKIRSSALRAPPQLPVSTAANAVDLTGDDDSVDSVVVIDKQAVVNQQKQQPKQQQHIGIKRNMKDNAHAAPSPSDAISFGTLAASAEVAHADPLRTATKDPGAKRPRRDSCNTGGSLLSAASAASLEPAPAPAQSRGGAEIMEQLRQAQQEFQKAKNVFDTKQRHYNILIAQMNEYSLSNGLDVNLLSRQIDIFHPFLLEAKTKMEECERRLQAMAIQNERQSLIKWE